MILSLVKDKRVAMVLEDAHFCDELSWITVQQLQNSYTTSVCKSSTLALLLSARVSTNSESQGRRSSFRRTNSAKFELQVAV